MNYQLLVAMVKAELTDNVIKAGRDAGAPVATVLAAHASGIPGATTFFGMEMNAASNVILFLLEEHMVDDTVMEAICTSGSMDRPCFGVSFVFPISNVRGLHRQQQYCEEVVEQLSHDSHEAR